MAQASPLVMVTALAAIVLASLAKASGQDGMLPEPAQQAPSQQVDPAEPFLAAIKDEQTSIVEQAPKCGQGTILSGTLVLETPERPGFPLTATTIASPRGTFTTVTTTVTVSAAIIDEVGKALNKRANDYVKRLLRNCSL